MFFGFAISAREALPVIEALRLQSGGDPRTEGYLGVELGNGETAVRVPSSRRYRTTPPP